MSEGGSNSRLRISKVSIICLFAYLVPTRGTVLSRMTNERDSRMTPVVGKASIVADWKIRT